MPLPLLPRIFLPFAAGYFLSYAYRTINAVLVPHLAADVNLDATALGLLTSVYLLAFGAFQLPLGVLLDRYSPPKVEAILLLLAAVGAGLFAVSNNLGDLVIGRALIGLGVSACLMASLKTFVLWFPLRRLPAVNGWVMAAGGLGALAATAPVEAALEVTSWRGVFAGLAVLTGLTAVAIFLIVPEHPATRHRSAWRAQWQGVVKVFTSRTFWRLAPLGALTLGAHIAIQGLWAGPWLKDVAGCDRGLTAHYLFWAAAGMVAGFLSLGTLTYRLNRLDVPPAIVAVAGMVVFIGIELALTAGYTGTPLLLWIAFGFFGTASTLSYAILSQAFPPGLAGRVNTAFNLLVFIAAFVMQWGLGAVIDLWPRTAAGGYATAGYSTGLGLVVVLQIAALGWLWCSRSLSRPEGRGFPRNSGKFSCDNGGSRGQPDRRDLPTDGYS
ncbi:MAG: MFS transporter [Candidatus Competibacteraceae bacterium]